MNELVICHNIPIPPMRVTIGKWKTVFSKMNIGDSVEIEGVKIASAFVAAKNMKIKITTRKQENGKIRIWKIEGNVANLRPLPPK